MGSTEKGVDATNGLTVDISVALKANDPKSVPGLSVEIASAGSSLDDRDYNARQSLLRKARALVTALETPRETMIKHNWAENCPQKVQDIATALEIDPELLSRLMRHISAMGYIKEVGPDEYESTNFSRALTIPIIGDGYPCIMGGCFAAIGHLPAYLKTTNFVMPNSATNGCYQSAYSTKMNFFQYLQAHQPWGTQFNHHMGGYRQGRPAWMDPDFYPVQDRLINGADMAGNAPFLVDIGGNVGHDLAEFLSKHPSTPGRLILQDLPVVIGQIQEGSIDMRIERMEYDFHTEQPVKHARAYYMHSVLHDWPDEVCTSILAQVTAAMKPEYSKLLINENVIPPTQANWQTTGLDMMMLSLFASKERTEVDWRRLLEGAGLKIVKIWGHGEGVESLIECELA
ncbi:S-adenosyl-L-methionine-dependent methyltransferase [Coniochaeta ligniaria NRRL 30616]|uniref:S-adenosyl-L-methionine-dependent methyltransferase n=1 Tax=Coniochaeta ligniaria NRRL 30616 TaxID=1408157 RepID=A0A1J7I4S3_9PEZI|nr:S-adenosyl-L-methionine-dependent methyltransferase [Coniochaeta ligniaria NRRL 30616]